MTATAPPMWRHQTAVDSSVHSRGRPDARALLACLLALCALASSPVFVKGVEAQGSFHWPEGMSVADFPLAQGGEVLIENMRGPVRVMAYDGDRVELAVFDGAASKAARGRGAKTARGRGAARAKAQAKQPKMPVAIQRAGDSLKISVERASAASSGAILLAVGVPANARVKVHTSDGALEVLGLPASLDAQTISGDLKLALPSPPDADLTAQSLN